MLEDSRGGKRIMSKPCRLAKRTNVTEMKIISTKMVASCHTMALSTLRILSVVVGMGNFRLILVVDVAALPVIMASTRSRRR